MRKRLAVFAVILLLVPMLCACQSDEQKIEARVYAIVDAFNSGDMEAVLDCYDAKTRNANKALMNIGGGLLGMAGIDVGLADLFGLTVGLMSDGELVRVEDMQISINGDNTRAEVSATLYYHDIEGGYDMPLELTLIKEDGDWYITP